MNKKDIPIFKGWHEAGEFSKWVTGYLVGRYDVDFERIIYYICSPDYKDYEVDLKTVKRIGGKNE